ncbi:MAG: tetratricopeptide repeat protein [Thermoleophilia bacterium]
MSRETRMTHATRFVAVAVLVALALCGPVQAQTPAADALRVRAEAGDAEAQLNLGFRYAAGLGTHPQDHAEAVRWYRLAADQGNASAQYSLGFMYAMARGVPQDYVQAHMWFNLAASRSTGEQRDESVSNRDRPAGQLTPDGLNEAQRLASPDAPMPVLTEHIPTAMPCHRRRLPLSRTNQCASG